MRKLKNLFLAGAILISLFVSGQDQKEGEKEKGYQFTPIKEIPCTPVKDQNQPSTCLKCLLFIMLIPTRQLNMSGCMEVLILAQVALFTMLPT
jgi:hypothetical protein